MVASQSNLQLLSAVLVLLRPFGVVFLYDFALLHDPLDLFDDCRAHAHCFSCISTLYPDIGARSNASLGHNVSILSFRIRLSFL